MNKRNSLIEKLIILLIVLILATIGYKFYSSRNVDQSPPAAVDKELSKDEDLNVDEINYDDYKNFVEDNLDRYKEYHLQHPELSADEVIWRVNRRLDEPFYENVSIIEEPTEETVVVNKYNQLNPSFVPSDLVEFTEGLQVSEKIKQPLTEMLSDAEKAGYSLKVITAYVSYEQQDEKYQAELADNDPDQVDLHVARAGHSEHQTGLAVDIIPKKYKNEADVLEADETEFFEWLNENAHRYGFIQSYKEGAAEVTGYSGNIFHWRFVGEENAIDIKENAIRTLEEYIDKGGLIKE